VRGRNRIGGEEEDVEVRRKSVLCRRACQSVREGRSLGRAAVGRDVIEIKASAQTKNMVKHPRV